MIIRKINEIDAEKFLNMLKRLDNETENMIFEPGERKTTIDEMKRDIRNILVSNSLTLLAEDNGEIVGFLSAERGFANRIKHSAYIVVGVLGGHRGKGIGSKLFEELEKWAKASDIKRLELTVMIHNHSAVRLYKKAGFKIEGVKERSLTVNGKYINEYYMAKLL